MSIKDSCLNCREKRKDHFSLSFRFVQPITTNLGLNTNQGLSFACKKSVDNLNNFMLKESKKSLFRT